MEEYFSNVATLLAKLPPGLPVEQLKVVHAALAEQAQLVHEGAKNGSESGSLRQVAKAHGPSVAGCLKAIGPLMNATLPPDSAKLLSQMACTALDALDALRGVLKPKGLDLEVQRYNYVRRMLMLGQHAFAMQAGWVLHQQLQGLLDKAGGAFTEVEDMIRACNLHLLLSASEAIQTLPVPEAHLCLQRLVPVCAHLTESMQSGRGDQKPAQQESVFKSLFKVLQQGAVVCSATGDAALQAQLLQVFHVSAGPVQQVHKLPQYIVKLLGDMTAEPGCMVLQGLLLIAGSSGRPLPELVALQCVDAAVKHLLAKHGASARAESLPSWEDAVDGCPSLAISHAAAVVRSGNTSLLKKLCGSLGVACSLLEEVVQMDSSEPESQDSLQVAVHLVTGLRRAVADVGEDLMLDSASAATIAQCLTASAALAINCLASEDNHIYKVDAQSALTACMLACKLAATSTHHADLAAAAALAMEPLVPYLLEAGEALDWAAANLAATGQELSDANHVYAAAELLAVAAAMCMASLPEGGDAALAQAEKTCRAHVSILLNNSMFSEAAAAAAAYFLSLSQFLAASLKPAVGLVRLHAKARVALLCRAADAATQPPSSTGSAAQGPRDATPARRGRRMQAMQTRTAPAAPAPASDIPPPLTQFLIEAWAAGEGTEELAEVLDLVAYEEVATMLEGCQVGSISQAPAAVQEDLQALLHALGNVFHQKKQPALHARAAMVLHLCNPSAGSGSATLQEAAATLSAHIPSRQAPVGLHHVVNITVPAAIAHTMLALQAAQTAAAGTQGQGTQAASDEPGASLAAPTSMDLDSDDQDDSSSGSCIDSSCSSYSSNSSRDVSSSKLWETSYEHMQHATQSWEAFAEAVEELHDAGSGLQKLSKGLYLVQPMLCLQMLTQLWQLAALQDRPRVMSVAASTMGWMQRSGVKISKSLAMAWAMVMPGTGCTTWALGPRLEESLLEKLGYTARCIPQMQHVLQELTNVRQYMSSGTYQAHSYSSSLHSIAVAAAAATDVPNQYGHIWLLMRTQIHVLAAHAFLQQGCTHDAYAHAQEALRLSSAVRSSCMSASSSNQAMILWQSVSQYLSSLVVVAEVSEAAGLVEDATCLLRECNALASTLGCTTLHSIASIRLAHMALRQRDVDAANTHVKAAEQQLQVVCRAMDTSGVLINYIEAGICQCRAGIAGSCGDEQHALQLYSQALQATADSGAKEGEALAWRVTEQRCQIHVSLVKQHLTAGVPVSGAAQHHLQQAAEALQCCTLDPCMDLSCSWPLQLAELLMVQVGVRYPPALCGDATPSDSILPDPSLSGVTVSPPSSGINELEDRFSQVLQLEAEVKTKPQRSKGTGTKSKGTAKSAPAVAEPQIQKSCPSGLKHEAVLTLLHALLLCWQTPSLATAACARLLGLTWALGFPHAASFFFQLRLGFQAAQHQVLSASASQVPWAHIEASDGAESPGRPQPAIEAATKLSELLQTAREAVTSAVRDSKASFGQPAGSSKARTTAAAACAGDVPQPSCLTRLDAAAASWLDSTLADQPEGSSVAGIAALPECHQLGPTRGCMLLCRLTKGAPPLLLAVPAPAAHTGQPSQQQSGYASCKGNSSAATPLLTQLAQLLNDSTHSMKSMDTDTAAAKSLWWKARLSLDEQMSELLRHMESVLLSQWHLLLLPISPATRAALQPVAAVAAEQHFATPGSNSSSGTSIICELLILLMANLGGMDEKSRQQAVQQLCQVTQQSTEDGHVSTLTQALTEAAAAALPNPLACEGVSCSMAATQAGAPPCAIAEVARSIAGSVRQPVVQAVLLPPASSIGGVNSAGTAATARRKGSRLAALQDSSSQATSAGALPASGARAGRTRKAVTAAAPTPAVPRPAAGRVRSSRASQAAAAEAASEASDVHSSQLDQGPGATEDGGAAGAAAQGGPGNHIILLLDCELQALPWESMPCIKRSCAEVYRMPSLLATAARLHVMRGNHLTVAAVAPAASIPVPAQQPTSKAGRRSKAPVTGVTNSTAGSGDSTGYPAAATVDLSCTYYLLNPGGDLVQTQKAFESWFCEELGWKGTAGSRPAIQELLHALQSHSLFVYFGHGSGEQYLPLSSLRKLKRCAANLLMGCSSGRLRQHGEYGASGAVLEYLSAGCPAVVANLWDVTDRDIDRFSEAVIKTWLGQSAPRTAGRTPASAGDGNVGDSRGSICGAVRASRNVCKLPHLIGAAPVCYGLPTHVLWGK